ncbi:aminodeoxychorismate/anthranilate synthase component II [Pseudoalteromonas sp. SSMSWG5]|jgi:anthranilate synthase component 2|uniref:aminodeoxychorismate/anthranilate synthase component II n=1 Tax=Pseudoalteromonas TaxID=53246 RepID=UPI000C39E1B3|nr:MULTISPECIES: aminodeoxychorismate/anthranilate synthase component II [unclassified Pseudoalteromonas]MBD55591.1 anthranilate synthase component II [Pseudoalteromonas sp.]MEC8207090.1 aminodeoxychorismate/anthranilate synthase component II [Pseudomonadota bacterium]MCF2902419.1 aminodeoxychorismate/anthranilate synthase component II [Pseudoalteromonas sp. OFAV1]MCF2920257.1 aminodeoxychorismate/anthranilate synthase component II [Pseudoalteromonas sp. APAL1]MCO7251275.1 aminodeoxychorismate|tara:strand:- start:669 stop:1274 length:606 start_codon:yes stop_codon:yes gene_type:complete
MTTTSAYKIYFLDNFDSFSYNLVDELSMLGCQLVVYRNNISAQSIFEKMCQETVPVLLVLSPGPGAPSDAGCLMELIELCKGRFPMLGICLGQQALTQSYGGVIGHAGETVHGKSSIITLTEHPVFAGMGDKMPVARYHSLMATKVPDDVEVIACYENIPMAIYHQQDNALGYQFHPESILTPNGALLLQQSIEFLTARVQ